MLIRQRSGDSEVGSAEHLHRFLMPAVTAPCVYADAVLLYAADAMWIEGLGPGGFDGVRHVK